MNTNKIVKSARCNDATHFFIVRSVSFVIYIFLAAPFFAGANDSDEHRIRTQCFSTLKENLTEAGIIEHTPALLEFNKMTYADVEPLFSENYKNLSSFGIELSEASLEMRVYSFGRQTGYVHPPKLPFPSSYESDTWASPAKEFIIAEEYAVDSASQKHFISCAFFTIQSENLLQVTRENYAYDGAMLSLTKVDPKGNYNAWYSQNTSYNYQDEPLVDWTRLFIYPKETQNSYFDKYSVAEAFPANKVQNFNPLLFFQQNLIVLQDNDETGNVHMKYVLFDGDHQPTEVNLPTELKPISPEGLDKVFPLTSYYQAIEDHFPEFAENLSLRGTLKYETYKKLIIAPSLDPETEKLLNVIVDPRQLARYSLDKESMEKQGMKVTDPQMDKLLIDVRDIDALVGPIPAASTTPGTLGDASVNYSKIIMWIGALSVCLLMVTLVVITRRRKFDSSNSPI
jgi:hypothetical protein